MNELQRSGTGQYAHGNQPCHHVLYLYDHTDSAWKTAPLVRAIGDHLYHATADGYPGDEDTGSLGSWYVFTALGFYPIQPGEPTYALGAPRFRRAELAFENGRTLVVEAVGVEELAAVYVQSVPSTGVVCRRPSSNTSAFSVEVRCASKWARCRGSTYIRQCREDGSGEPGGNRTHGQRLKRPLLYP